MQQRLCLKVAPSIKVVEGAEVVKPDGVRCVLQRSVACGRVKVEKGNAACCLDHRPHPALEVGLLLVRIHGIQVERRRPEDERRGPATTAARVGVAHGGGDQLKGDVELPRSNGRKLGAEDDWRRAEAHREGRPCAEGLIERVLARSVEKIEEGSLRVWCRDPLLRLDGFTYRALRIGLYIALHSPIRQSATSG